MNELTMELKLGGKTPLYEQIYRYIKRDIQDGKIKYQEKLPSTRTLSRHLEVSRSTVELAYEQLLSEGYIEAIPCKGFYVSQIETVFPFQREKKRMVSRTEAKKEEYKYNFTPNGVDLNSFPYHIWRKLSREILTDDRAELFRSGDSKGEYGFRCAIANYLYQARGVHCVPEQIIVGAGSDYLLMLLSTIIGKEHVLGVEDPVYKQAYRLFLSLSYEVKAVRMDQNGMEVKALSKSGADIAYVTPSHQYPTGVIMPINRRMELLKWADDKEGRYIIEDDYDSEYRYKGKPIPALQGYDVHGKVIYLGTFSKSIAPAIRLSYMVLQKPLLEIYEKKCRFLHSTVSKVDQLIVQRFIEEGHYERHLNKTRALYKGRHDVILAGLRPLAGISRISGEHAGVHILLTFKGKKTEREFIEKAKEEGIKVYGLSEYEIEQTSKNEATILLGYANMSEKQIEEACDTLIRIWGE